LKWTNIKTDKYQSGQISKRTNIKAKKYLTGEILKQRIIEGRNIEAEKPLYTEKYV
jgi:hypothetical protein